MLSNTADKNPKPSAVCQDAIGKRSTGIIEAINTSESRKIALRNALGSTSQSGRRKEIDKRIATQTATPIKGNCSACCRNLTFTTTFVASASVRIRPTMPIRIQSRCTCSCTRFRMGKYLCCVIAAGIPKTINAVAAGMIASNTCSGETPAIHIIVVVVSPNTLHAPPAFEAPTIAAK